MSNIDSYSGCGLSYYQGRVGWRGDSTGINNLPDTPGPLSPNEEEDQIVNSGRKGITQPPFPRSLREERRGGAGHSSDCTKARICWLPMRLREHSLASQLPVQQTGTPSPSQLHQQQNTVGKGGRARKTSPLEKKSKIHLISLHI